MDESRCSLFFTGTQCGQTIYKIRGASRPRQIRTATTPVGGIRPMMVGNNTRLIILMCHFFRSYERIDVFICTEMIFTPFYSSPTSRCLSVCVYVRKYETFLAYSSGAHTEATKIKLVEGLAITPAPAQPSIPAPVGGPYCGLHTPAIRASFALLCGTSRFPTRCILQCGDARAPKINNQLLFSEAPRPGQPQGDLYI